MKRMRILFTAAMAVLALQSASAQEVAIGIKGGLNFANINTSSVGAAYDSRTGYHAGAFVMFKFTKIAIQPEIIYSQQGSTIKFNSSNFDSNFSYLNIPILLKLYLVGGLNLQAGPQFGFLMSATGPVDSGGGNITTGDIKSSLKSSDFSAALGAGWDFPFGLNLGVRYNLGLSDINNQANAEAVKNQVWQVSAGFKLIKFGN